MSLDRLLQVAGQRYDVQATLHTHWTATLQAGLPAVLDVTDSW
jgi:hypothetical protein